MKWISRSAIAEIARVFGISLSSLHRLLRESMTDGDIRENKVFISRSDLAFVIEQIILEWSTPEEPIDPADFLTVKEAAAFIRHSPWSVYRLARTKQIPSFRMGGRIFFSRHGLKAYVASTSEPVLQEEKAEYADVHVHVVGCGYVDLDEDEDEYGYDDDDLEYPLWL